MKLDIMKEKEIYEIGEIPPLGVIPKKMYAWVIRKDREDVPEKAVLDAYGIVCEAMHLL